MTDEFPCHCGHAYGEHLWDEEAWSGAGCQINEPDDRESNGRLWCQCWAFKPDNLRYLEQLSEH